MNIVFHQKVRLTYTFPWRVNIKSDYLEVIAAGVAQHGQRRCPEAAVPLGFVGSNPTPRIILHTCKKSL